MKKWTTVLATLLISYLPLQAFAAEVPGCQDLRLPRQSLLSFVEVTPEYTYSLTQPQLNAAVYLAMQTITQNPQLTKAKAFDLFKPKSWEATPFPQIAVYSVFQNERLGIKDTAYEIQVSLRKTNHRLLIFNREIRQTVGFSQWLLCHDKTPSTPPLSI